MNNYADAYREFMYDPDNHYNCKKCPENRNAPVGFNFNILPCGQYHCWVDLHCKEKERYDD